MATANKVTRFVVTASFGLSLAIASQASTKITQVNQSTNKVQKVTIHGKYLTDEQKRIFDEEQKNKLSMQKLEKNPVMRAHEILGNSPSISIINKNTKPPVKTT